MNKSSFLLCLAIPGVACGTLLSFVIFRPSRGPLPILLKHVDNTNAIGTATDFIGKKNAPFTLIEFGDYECPPCKAMEAHVAEFMSSHKDQVRYSFRNCPLPIHPKATPAAIAAESARFQGRYWEMHKELYNISPDLNDASIKKAVVKLGVDPVRFERDKDRARKVVDQDLVDVELLGVKGTPTFVLCGPDRKVWRVYTLRQAEGLMANTQPFKKE